MNAIASTGLIWCLAVALAGCGKSTPTLKLQDSEERDSNSASNKINLSLEIAEAITKIKGGEIKTLPELTPAASTLYPTQHDENGVQFWIAGNRTREVIDILSFEYGVPKLIQTNATGRINAAFTVAQTGAAISIADGAAGTNAYTHVIITKQPPKLF